MPFKVKLIRLKSGGEIATVVAVVFVAAFVAMMKTI